MIARFRIKTQRTLWLTLPGVVIPQAMIFYYHGHCHRSWYSVSFSDLVCPFRSATLSVLCLLAFDRLFGHNLHPLLRGVFLLDWAMTILVLGGLRAVGPRVSRGVESSPVADRLPQSPDRWARQSIGRNAGPALAVGSPLEISTGGLPGSRSNANWLDGWRDSRLGRPRGRGAGNCHASGGGGYPWSFPA